MHCADALTSVWNLSFFAGLCAQQFSVKNPDAAVFYTPVHFGPCLGSTEQHGIQPQQSW
jgi:hypothetical protein